MSFDKVEVRVFSGPDQVQVGSNTEPDLIVMNIGPKGDTGATGNTGATGPAGPNSVTSATTSDGTANLSLGDLEVVGGEIYTDGEYSSIYTQGATAHIFTLGSGAEIFTEGELAQIYTTGASAQIYTAGAGATIGTQGANATIYTQGTNATISTAGSAAHIQTTHASAAVKSTNFAAVESGGASLVDGSMQPCLTWSAGGRNLTIPSGTAVTFDSTSYTYGTGAAAAHRTALGLTTLATTTAGTNVANFLEFPTSANLASALTDENGTGGGFVRAEGATLTSPSIAGTAAFTGTTRPTSAGNGTPAATSLITSNDAYYRNIVNPLKQGEIPLIPLSQFYAESALAGYTLNSTLQSNLSVYADPSTAQNSWYRYILSTSIFNQINNQWSYTRGSELFFLISNVVTSKDGTRHQIAIANTPPEGTIDTASRFGLAIEVFFVSGVLYARLLRKLTAASSLETSSSVAFSGTFGALWLRTNANGSVELRVLSSSNFTTLPLRPESASVTLPSGTYTNAAGSLYMTGLATSATIVDNGCYFQVHKAQYHIDS